ncbi:MAG: hypothetical protein LUG83_03220 [Lachnospiraceae bacterium]|nr:hypothetical protein [Lachnospiraceae bacterium]
MAKNKVIFSIFMVALLLFGIIGLEYYEYIAEGKIAGFNIADCRVLTSGLSIETQIFIGIYAVYVYIFCNCFKISGQISIVITSFILAIFSVFGRCLVVTGSIYVAVSRGGYSLVMYLNHKLGLAILYDFISNFSVSCRRMYFDT